MSYPPQSRYSEPDYPEQGYPEQGYRSGQYPQRRQPEQGVPDDPAARRGYTERDGYRTGGQPQQRYSAPPAQPRGSYASGEYRGYEPSTGGGSGGYRAVGTGGSGGYRAVGSGSGGFGAVSAGGGYGSSWDDEDDEPGPVKKRTGLKVFMIVIGTLLLLCSGALGIAAYSIHDSYPAHVALDDEVAGLKKIEDKDLQSGADDIVAALRTSRGVTEAVAGVYGKDGDATHPIIILAAAGLFLRPESELVGGMTEFNTDGFSFEEPLDVEPGPQGGSAKCSLGSLALDKDQSMDIILCGWADHGAVGLAAFLNTKEASAATELLLKIRDDVESH